MESFKNLLRRGLALAALASFVAAPLRSHAQIFPPTTETLQPYNHGFTSMTGTVMSSVWLENDPEDSSVAGFTYSTDPVNPQYYFAEVTVFVGIVDTNGTMNAGDLANVQS